VRLVFVLDCGDPDALADFWTAALHYRRSHRVGPYLVLVPVGWDIPELLLQQVPEPKVGKNRAHFDLRAPGIEAEVTRLCSLGATMMTEVPVEEDGVRWVVMADPDGNEFCVVEEHASL
jgi:predicted enzyme related to lactoylglutathione lyase